MIRICSALAASIIAISASAPVFAEDPAPTPAAEPAKAAPSSSDGKIVGYAKRLPSFVVGWVGGTPIAMVRKGKQEIASGISDLVGENRNPVFVGLASIFAIPYGGVGGIIGGPIVAGINSWKYSADEPFSRSSFSLEDLD
ncbi:MAG: hypothetical protein K2X81_16020 [Candidatus Obscuribacterales bacterium]|nr:hypothetical protein [Candidatus Obscuribacterales bacterium]